jgi:hypothetical protein
MSQLYLPAEHTEADLVLAGTIAERLGSEELYVVWTDVQGPAVPEVAALLREPTPHWADPLAFLFQAVRELWTALLGRDALAPHPGQIRPADAPAPQAKPAPGEAAA